MVAHLGLRTHELLYEEIGNIIAEILSAWEKAECYEEVANHSQRIFTLIQNNNFLIFTIYPYIPFIQMQYRFPVNFETLSNIC